MISRRVIPAVLLAASLLVAGCQHFSSRTARADFPAAEQFPQVYQGKLMAAAHWQVIADKEAELLAARFEPDSAFTLAVEESQQPDANAPRFALEYRHMLTEGLLQRGMRVFDKGGDFALSYRLAVVDLYRDGDPETPNTEIVLTTAVRYGDQVMYSHSSVYYFSEIDRGLYDPCVGPECPVHRPPANDPDAPPRFRVAEPMAR
jgi:hypothetical protein